MLKRSSFTSDMCLRKLQALWSFKTSQRSLRVGDSLSEHFHSLHGFNEWSFGIKLTKFLQFVQKEASFGEDHTVEDLVDQAIDLWTSMNLAEGAHLQQLSSNVHTLQYQCSAMCDDISAKVGTLQSASQTSAISLQSSNDNLASERDATTQDLRNTKTQVRLHTTLACSRVC